MTMTMTMKQAGEPSKSPGCPGPVPDAPAQHSDRPRPGDKTADPQWQESTWLLINRAKSPSLPGGGPAPDLFPGPGTPPAGELGHWGDWG